MRYLLFTLQLLTVFAIQKSQAQQFNDGLEIEQANPSRYLKDAEQQAARITARINQSEDISPELINELEGVLWAISQDKSSQAQAIAQQFNIHSRTIAHPHDFLFYTADSGGWVNKYIHTRNPQHTPFAELFAAYPNLSLSFEGTYDGFYSFAIHSEVAMNMDFFHQQFSNQSDILWTTLPDNDAKGNDIKVEKIAAGWRVSYILRNLEGYPSDYEYTWSFGVDKNNQVHFFYEGSNYNALPPNYQLSDNPEVYLRP
jgi:hypothetical protein